MGERGFPEEKKACPGFDGEATELTDEDSVVGASLMAGRGGMTPSDVIETVLSALRYNDSPSPNSGIQTLLSFMSDASSFGEVREPSKFVEYLTDPESPYGVLLDWQDCVFGSKLEVSLDGNKAYLIVRLRARGERGSDAWQKVKWALSKQRLKSDAGQEKASAWAVDNILVLTADADAGVFLYPEEIPTSEFLGTSTRDPDHKACVAPEFSNHRPGVLTALFVA
eukprot:CAMPEP_0172654010 /NCGR_PEP_ID=MMETSP1068-20121228/244116_1 /TAXON_ID=35684 /ORGANISM="Pseudopedinella elastica, Strain CCMP716" /LENGTH=224 /DNA_ID=CAMNT_0013468449 /DNA_START=456 /DNA_END=1131 /DNA_ORIENTATION=-